jgi:hypothetical protein
MENKGDPLPVPVSPAAAASSKLKTPKKEEQESILRNSFSAKKFSVKFSSNKF